MERTYSQAELMYNPQIEEYERIITDLEEFHRNLTPERARERLFKAGLIDIDGNPTEPYRDNSQTKHF